MSQPFPREVSEGVVIFDIYAIPGVRELIDDHLQKQWEDHCDDEKDQWAKRVTTIKVTSQVDKITSQIDKDGDPDVPIVEVQVSQRLAPASKATMVKIVDGQKGKEAQMRLF